MRSFEEIDFTGIIMVLNKDTEAMYRIFDFAFDFFVFNFFNIHF